MVPMVMMMMEMRLHLLCSPRKQNLGVHAECFMWAVPFPVMRAPSVHSCLVM